MVTGYFYWDPNRAMFDFNLPLLGRPILWYGFLFAFGFFVAYWVLVYLLRCYFLYHSEVFFADIVHWPDLILKLKGREKHRSVFKVIFSHCSADVQKQIDHYEPGRLMTKGLQEGVVRGINACLRDADGKERPMKERGLLWVQRHLSPFGQLRLQRRLALEQDLFPLVKTLRRRAKEVAERLTVYVVIGTLVGARLGDLLFYQDWKILVQDPLAAIRIWEGGLASHGGAAGILIALVFFDRIIRKAYPIFSLIKILDYVVIPTALAAIFIRIGNFVNQEILGKPTDVPWAVVFGHPADGAPIVPRHPVQLYEALAYLSIFFFLVVYWRRKPFSRPEGKISGLFLIFVFSARFFLEFFKEEQSVYLNNAALLSMGQLLSLPFIALGFWLFFHRKNEFARL